MITCPPALTASARRANAERLRKIAVELCYARDAAREYGDVADSDRLTKMSFDCAALAGKAEGRS